jgi:enoyl-CoA hydratase/carnithine racemase
MQVTLEREGHLAIITLNAPGRLNAIDAAMGGELDLALVEAGTDDTVRAILLTGAGAGFCAGASMERLEEVTAGGGAKRGSSIDLAAAFPGAEPALCRRYTLPLAIPKPVLAGVCPWRWLATCDWDRARRVSSPASRGWVWLRNRP